LASYLKAEISTVLSEDSAYRNADIQLSVNRTRAGIRNE